MKHILAILCIALLVCACGTQNPGTTKQDQDYRTGSGSLTITSIKNAPPSQLREGENYVLALKLQNAGATDIVNGRILVTTDQTLLELNRRGASLNLHGKSKYWPVGESSVQEFGFTVNTLAQESQQVDADILMTACFPYRTIQTVDVCMDADPYELQESTTKKVCKQADPSPSAGGGPLNVNKITFRLEKDGDIVTPKFSFFIKKPTDGVVTRTGDEVNLCQLSYAPADKSFQFLAHLSDQQLLCDKEALAFNPQGEASVTCAGLPFNIKETGTFKTTMTMQLDYGYVVTKSSKVTIIKN